MSDAAGADPIPLRALLRRTERLVERTSASRPGHAHVHRLELGQLPELERLLPLLRIDQPRLYRAVVGVYVHPRFIRRAVCPKCRHVARPASSCW